MSHPAYRFYNTVSDSHFYTVDAAERDSVIANLPTFKYEGPAFGTVDAGTPGSVDVFRFYNDTNKTHFFTADAGERDTVINTLPNYHYEGVAYHAAAAPADGLQPLFRFYNVDAQTHFYTADAAERDNVAATLPNFRYEGVAFYEPKADAPTPVVPVPAPVTVYPVPVPQEAGVLVDQDLNVFHLSVTDGLPHTIIGQPDGVNFITGGSGNDTIIGGGGYNSITGGRGSDTMTGGPGRNDYHIERGDGGDVITNYHHGDHLIFHGMHPTDVYSIFTGTSEGAPLVFSYFNMQPGEGTIRFAGLSGVHDGGWVHDSFIF